MYTLRAVQVCGYAKVDMTFGVPGPLDGLEIWEALQLRAISSACLMLYRPPRLPRQGMSVTKLRQAQLHLVGRYPGWWIQPPSSSQARVQSTQ